MVQQTLTEKMNKYNLKFTESDEEIVIKHNPYDENFDPVRFMSRTTMPCQKYNYAIPFDISDKETMLIYNQDFDSLHLYDAQKNSMKTT